MGRIDIGDQRRPQIIAAAKRVISMYGIDGATQERIAEAAGMTRPHIRHYVGNRDELLDAVWTATVGDYVRSVEEATAVTGAREDVARSFDRLLALSFVYEEDDAVILAYLHKAREDERVRARTHATYAYVEQCVARLLRSASPDAADAQIAARAHALMAMSMGAIMLDLLDPARPRADRLIPTAAALLPTPQVTNAR